MMMRSIAVFVALSILRLHSSGCRVHAGGGKGSSKRRSDIPDDLFEDPTKPDKIAVPVAAPAIPPDFFTPHDDDSDEPKDEPVAVPISDASLISTEPPTAAKTDNPTKAPTKPPTAANTDSPTKAPTEAPTVMPGSENDPSIIESAPPTPSIAGTTEDAPSFISCNTNEGAYGSLQGELLIVDFLYSVALDREISRDDYLRSVGPGLEIQMNDHLLPVLFAEELEHCVREKPAGADRRSLLQRRLQAATAIVAGMSARPLDSVISDDEKGYSLLGQITLYLTKEDNSSRRRYLQSPGSENTNNDALVEQTVREALQKAMMEGAFNDNPPIATVSYMGSVGSTENGNGNTGGDNSDSASPADSTSNAKSVNEQGDTANNKRNIVLLTIIIFLTIVATGCLLYLLCGKKWQRRRRGGEDGIEYVRQVSQSSSLSNSSQGAASRDLGVVVVVESGNSNKDERSSSGTIGSSSNNSSEPPASGSQSSDDSGSRYKYDNVPQGEEQNIPKLS